jgi:hypothetical protein
MRINYNYVYFTKKEERAIFEYYYNAITQDCTNRQQNLLDVVRDQLIEGMGTLTYKTWNEFVEVMAHLDIEIDDSFSKDYIINKGSCYTIPNKKREPQKHFNAMYTRREWRNQFQSMFQPVQSKNSTDSFTILMTKLSIENYTDEQYESIINECQLSIRNRKSILRVIDGGIG